MSFSKWHTCGEATLLSTSLGSEMQQNMRTLKWNRNIEHKQQKENHGSLAQDTHQNKNKCQVYNNIPVIATTTVASTIELPE